jgi:large subunit ribosomal protein L4
MALTARILGGKKTAKLDENVFALEVNEPLLHEAVKAEGAAKRQGTHATKTRGQVAGGRSKPWRQKGTGRARQGTTRAAHWRGGGAVFGPQPRSYHLKMNRKAYRRARAIALSVHASRGTLAAFDAASFSAPRTKDAIALLGDLDARPLVVVVTEEQANAALSFRNLERAVVLTADELEVTATLWARQLLVSTDALEVLTARLQPEPKVRQEVAA